jgi:hypothetical protein
MIRDDHHNEKIKEISLITLQKIIRERKLTYDFIPVYINFDVNQDLYITCRYNKDFRENYCSVSELLRIQNTNIFDSVILTNEQYEYMNSLTVSVNEGNVFFILMYYFIFLSFGVLLSLRIFV